MHKKPHKRSVFTYSLPKGKEQPCEGVFVSFISSLRSHDPGTVIKGYIPRIINIVTKHYRGIFGMLLPIYCAFTWHWEKDAHYTAVKYLWMWMLWFFLFQPVPVPVTGLIPIFFLPMTGVLSTPETCGCYMNESITLFILSGMLILLLNNSGADRRIALWLMCSGDNCQFSAKRLLFKISTAAFFLSMFSNRLLVTASLTDYMTEALTDLQLATNMNRVIEPDYDELRYIFNNAIQTASSIGSIAIMHSSYAALCFRAMFYESAPKGTEYPDVFNYFQYSVYAFPTASVMFILNCYYHKLLINNYVPKPISPNSMKELRNALLQYKNTLPRRVSFHEKLTVYFTIFSLIIFFTRWNSFLNMGWANFSKDAVSPQLPGVKDATVAAIFVIALHILPKGCGWLKYCNAEKKSELPPLKTESAILYWRFVDKNLNYGYIFLIGSGVALHAAIKETGLDKRVVEHVSRMFTEQAFAASLFLVCFITVVLSNAMSGVAACVVFLPMILSMASELPPGDVVFRSVAGWPAKMYLGALAVGIGSSFGFMSPFLYTPAYYSHHIGKVPKKRMVTYSLGSAVICLIVLWCSLVYLAPYIWDPDGSGVIPVRHSATPSVVSATNDTTLINGTSSSTHCTTGTSTTGTLKSATTKSTITKKITTKKKTTKRKTTKRKTTKKTTTRHTTQYVKITTPSTTDTTTRTTRRRRSSRSFTTASWRIQ